MLHQIFNLVTVILWQTITCSVGYVNNCSTCLYDGLYDSCEILIVRSTGILSIEFNILNILLGILHCPYSPIKDFLTIRIELILYMTVAGTKPGVNAFALSKLKAVGRNINIFLLGTCQRTDCRPCYSLANLNNRVEIARTGYRESGLNDINTQLLQLLCYLNLLDSIQLAPRNLLTITEGRVENVKSLTHV